MVHPSGANYEDICLAGLSQLDRFAPELVICLLPGSTRIAMIPSPSLTCWKTILHGSRGALCDVAAKNMLMGVFGFPWLEGGYDLPALGPVGRGACQRF